MSAQIGLIDWLVVAAYFVVLFGVAVWAIIQERKGGETSAGYFLAGRNVGWFVVGASLFASNIGSEHLVGLAGTGAADGLVLGQFELQASLILLLLGWFFVPFYIKSGVYTMPEFLERRFDSRSRWYLSIVSIIGYVLTKISVTAYAGAVVIEALTGIEMFTGALITVVITGIYTIFGGLRAVVYTELIQTFVLIAGALAVTFIGLAELGGVGVMMETVPDGFFNMWKPVTDPEFPWTGIAFGAPIIAVWYWCTDQFIVQRTLAAKGIDDARRGTIFAGFLKQLPLFLFVIPGVIAMALDQRGMIQLEAADQALPTLVSTLLPVGLRGLVVAGLLAALMSSLASVFNSCSTLVTLDVYKKMNPLASERRLVLVGQIATSVLVVLGVLWIPLMSRISGTLYQYLQSVQGYISPPIAAVFLLGLLWKRVNSTGAITALIVGFFLGMGRLIAELFKESIPQGTLLYLFADINFMHVAIFLFLICVAVLVIVSLLTEEPDRQQIAGLTFATANEPTAAETAAAEQRAAAAATLAAGEEPIITEEHLQEMQGSNPAWRRTDRMLSAVLLLIVAVIMITFSGFFF